MKLALGRVKECPFKPADVKALKDEVTMNLASMGIDLERSSGDRDDVPIDFRFLDFLLRAAEDPEVGIGNFAKGVRVGPGVRMPRLPALYKRKKKWRLASQADLRNYLEDEEAGGEHTWRRNYSSLDELSDKVIDVLEDQSKRGQILKLSEAEAKRQYPNLVVASLGANKKDKPSGEVTARVLFDGTHGLSVNTRTRIRDQERSPVASDLKRAMREKAALNEPTFALTADVSEAHRQIPIHKCDWHLLGCQVQAGGDVHINTVGRRRLHLESGGQGYRAALVVFFWCSVCLLLLVACVGCAGTTHPSISRWFSLEIRQEEWPWVYAKRQTPALVIATLEALAVLVALKLWFGEVPNSQQTRVTMVPSLTDNRGNGALLNKLMTTKFPASALLMELSTYMKRMNMRTVVEWAPRDCNREADQLANGIMTGFDPALRLHVSSSSGRGDRTDCDCQIGPRPFVRGS